MSGLYVPGNDGGFRFREAAEQEERPVLSYEEDTGVLLLNFNLVFVPRGRLLRDVILQTEGGVAMGLLLTTSAMGPEERRRRGLDK